MNTALPSAPLGCSWNAGTFAMADENRARIRSSMNSRSKCCPWPGEGERWMHHCVRAADLLRTYAYPTRGPQDCRRTSW
jgi:hypothetical protein